MLDKKRFRNYGFWIALVSQLLIVIQLGSKLVFDVSITEDMSAGIVALANGVLVVLSTLGIISNPTKPDGKGFNL